MTEKDRKKSFNRDIPSKYNPFLMTFQFESTLVCENKRGTYPIIPFDIHAPCMAMKQSMLLQQVMMFRKRVLAVLHEFSLA